MPGMVSAMVRHLHSLRTMKRDHGWISTLLGEAENERMHLLVSSTRRRRGVLLHLPVFGRTMGSCRADALCPSVAADSMRRDSVSPTLYATAVIAALS